jgi:choline transporter-like protein 2/4/5
MFLLVFLVLTLYLCVQGKLINADDLGQYGVTQSAADLAISSASADTVTYYSYAAYFFIVLDLIIFAVIIFLRGKIMVAGGIIKEAASAVGYMKTMIAFPFLLAIFSIITMAYFVTIGGYIGSAGEFSLENMTASASSFTGTNMSNHMPNIKTFEGDTVMQGMLVYHLLGSLWLLNLIDAVGICTLAGAVCQWYWVRNPSNRKEEMVKSPVFRSFKIAMRFHFGSLCFGSLIIAIIQTIRIIVEYIDKQTKEAQKGNKLLRIAMCCFRCCLWCFEKCMKFVSK